MECLLRPSPWIKKTVSWFEGFLVSSDTAITVPQARKSSAVQTVSPRRNFLRIFIINSFWRAFNADSVPKVFIMQKARVKHTGFYSPRKRQAGHNQR